MSTGTQGPPSRSRRAFEALNTSWHKNGLRIFLVIVLAHWAEHLTQAIQIYALGWPVPEARGVLGIPFPWLVTSEWMHYGHALVMLGGIILLRPGFTGRSRTWWNVTLGVQTWHHFEHLLLLTQALAGSYLFGKAAPTSIVQLVMPRVELHLFYNALVGVPGTFTARRLSCVSHPGHETCEWIGTFRSTDGTVERTAARLYGSFGRHATVSKADSEGRCPHLPPRR